MYILSSTEGAVELWVACMGVALRLPGFELAGVEREGAVELWVACVGVVPRPPFLLRIWLN